MSASTIRSLRLSWRSFPCAAPLAFVGLLACGSTPAGVAGGPVTGAPDDHCTVGGAMTKNPVGVCMAPGSGDAGTGPEDGGALAEAGAEAGTGGGLEYGQTLYNSEGYDDDCKYKVSFTSTPVRKNEAVTFTVTIVGLNPAGAATEAELEAEVFTVDETHTAPNTNTTATETPAGSGVYKVGPIKFDQAGRWVIRFHMYDRCGDVAADSPHGHAAFFIDVP